MTDTLGGVVIRADDPAILDLAALTSETQACGHQLVPVPSPAFPLQRDCCQAPWISSKAEMFSFFTAGLILHRIACFAM